MRPRADTTFSLGKKEVRDPVAFGRNLTRVLKKVSMRLTLTSTRGYTVLAPDLRGLGDTTKLATATTRRPWLGTAARSWRSLDSEHA
jgi:pimeloyl-ACP methyl ester carboxylesterase